MHKRAIKIKSDLLGSYDYEVGLSIGHLASLYSYHMKKYREAEQLYLKSIAISKCLHQFCCIHWTVDTMRAQNRACMNRKSKLLAFASTITEFDLVAVQCSYIYTR